MQNPYPETRRDEVNLQIYPDIRRTTWNEGYSAAREQVRD